MNGILLKHIVDKETCCSITGSKHSLLQIPPQKVVKSTPGRGSWPGPGASNSMNASNCLKNEFSKSEQQLSRNQDNISQYLSVCSDNTESRKNSDSYNSDYFTERMLPSKSEDILFGAPSTAASTSGKQRLRAHTLSATSSPLLSVRPMYSGSLLSVNTLNTTNNSDSVHSLSSDSETPLGSSTPNKKYKSKMIPSKSMTNMKQSDRNRGNLETKLGSKDMQLSKSLTNIKNDQEGKTYLKPIESVRKPDVIPDSVFKMPLNDFYSEAASSSSSGREGPQSGTIQVYAAYETGLASGTSLKLHVTPRTTAREVVDLVVKQLNMAVVLKGKDGPIYPPEQLKNFCLVAVIGARERCLRDDFKPLQLQNPWKKGRLYVRQKQDVLAALEHSSKHSAII